MYHIKHLIIPFLFLACTNAIGQKSTCVTHFDSGFSLYQDTIFVNIEGKMTHALKYHDKFYALFVQSVIKYGNSGKRWWCIFSDGEIEKNIFFSEKFGFRYLDFFVKNDSIILKQYMRKQCYSFDTQDYEWKEIEKTDDLIFEDEKFYVYSLDFGEWGGKTWFKDKKTGIEYEIEACTSLINKIDTTYYLTNKSKVLKIENPLNLNRCDEDVTYENIETSGKCYSWYGEPIGFDVVYEDITYDHFSFYFSYQPHIVSSFVWQNELLHIYETSTATYIAKIENNAMKPIQKIGENLRFYNGYHSYRCKNMNGNNELLKFRTEDEQLFGLMEIIDNEVFIHYIKNDAVLSPKSYEMAKADSIFVNRLNFILSGWDNLQLKNIDSMENKWESFDITFYSQSIKIDDKYTIDTCQSYLIREDSLILNTNTYYTAKSDDLLRKVIFEWEQTNGLKETFTKKLNFLEDCITKTVGKHIKDKEETNFTNRIWKTSNGLKIELSNHKYFNWIRLVIYKNGN